MQPLLPIDLCDGQRLIEGRHWRALVPVLDEHSVSRCLRRPDEQADSSPWRRVQNVDRQVTKKSSTGSATWRPGSGGLRSSAVGVSVGIVKVTTHAPREVFQGVNAAASKHTTAWVGRERGQSIVASQSEGGHCTPHAPRESGMHGEVTKTSQAAAHCRNGGPALHSISFPRSLHSNP